MSETDNPTDRPETQSGPNVLKRREDVRDAVMSVIALARRDIVVFSPQVDPFFFNPPALSRTLASFAARHANNRARFLVEDAAQVLRENDRLISVCRRFSESLQIREVAEEHRGLREMYLVVDGEAYLRQNDVTQPDCVVDVSARRHAVELRRKFNGMWERSEPLAGLYVAGLTS